MVKKIYQVLKNPEIDFEIKWLKDKRKRSKKGNKRKGVVVLGYHESDKIQINVFDLILGTIIHECLHDIFEKMPERMVEKKTYQICRRLTDRQKRYIIKLFGQRIMEGSWKY